MSGHGKGRKKWTWPAKDRRSRLSRRFTGKLNSGGYLTVRHKKEEGTPSVGLVLGRRRWGWGNLSLATTGLQRGSRRRRPKAMAWFGEMWRRAELGQGWGSAAPDGNDERRLEERLRGCAVAGHFIYLSC